MSRAVIYLRVSTDEQAESGLGLEAQRHACRDWCARAGLEVAGEHGDEGTSGAAPLADRPGLTAALAALARGDTLLVAKRDRLGRDPLVVATIESACARNACRIQSAAGEGTDADDPASVMMRRLIDAFAEYERLIIKQRTRDALRAKRRKGERTGGIPFGWEPDPDGPRHPESGLPLKLRPVPIEQERLRLVRGLHAEGVPARAIARRLNADAIPTKSGGGRWRHGSIAKMVRSDRPQVVGGEWGMVGGQGSSDPTTTHQPPPTTPEGGGA